MLKSLALDINFDQFLCADYSAQEDSSTKHRIHELQDIHENFNKLPETYVYENTKIHQLWWTAEQVNFDAIGTQLGMEVITVSSILQSPGCVIPWHRDTFYQIGQRFPDRTELKVRANIYLEDWKIGHFIQYQDTVDTHWRQGQGWLWDQEVPHLGANAGMQNKYTLQVSGFLK